EGGQGGAPLEGGRRGGHPLQPIVRPVSRVQRPRSDGVQRAENLGLRDELGQLRAVHQGAVAAAGGQAQPFVVGGRRQLRAHLFHRVSNAGGARADQTRR